MIYLPTPGEAATSAAGGTVAAVLVGVVGDGTTQGQLVDAIGGSTALLVGVLVTVFMMVMRGLLVPRRFYDAQAKVIANQTKRIEGLEGTIAEQHFQLRAALEGFDTLESLMTAMQQHRRQRASERATDEQTDEVP